MKRASGGSVEPEVRQERGLLGGVERRDLRLDARRRAKRSAAALARGRRDRRRGGAAARPSARSRRRAAAGASGTRSERALPARCSSLSERSGRSASSVACIFATRPARAAGRLLLLHALEPPLDDAGRAARARRRSRAAGSGSTGWPRLSKSRSTRQSASCVRLHRLRGGRPLIRAVLPGMSEKLISANVVFLGEKIFERASMRASGTRTVPIRAPRRHRPREAGHRVEHGGLARPRESHQADLHGGALRGPSTAAAENPNIGHGRPGGRVANPLPGTRALAARPAGARGSSPAPPSPRAAGRSSRGRPSPGWRAAASLWSPIAQRSSRFTSDGSHGQRMSMPGQEAPEARCGDDRAVDHRVHAEDLARRGPRALGRGERRRRRSDRDEHDARPDPRAPVRSHVLLPLAPRASAALQHHGDPEPPGTAPRGPEDGLPAASFTSRARFA